MIPAVLFFTVLCHSCEHFFLDLTFKSSALYKVLYLLCRVLAYSQFSVTRKSCDMGGENGILERSQGVLYGKRLGIVYVKAGILELTV